MSGRLLLVALPNSSSHSARTHQLLAERLVLLAMVGTRAQRIAFWEYPAIARSFNCENQAGWPDLHDETVLSILGNPLWAQSETTPWSEILVPNASLTSYIMQRCKHPQTRDVLSVVREGISINVTNRILESRTLAEAQAEAQAVQIGLDNKGKITKLSDVFRRKIEVTALLKANVISVTQVKTKLVQEVLDAE